MLVLIRAILKKSGGVVFQTVSDLHLSQIVNMTKIIGVARIGYVFSIPQFPNRIQIVDMRADVGGVDDPVIADPSIPSCVQLTAYKIYCVWKCSHMTGRLKVMEGNVIIYSMRACVLRLRQRTYPSVMITLASSTHMSVSIICPHLDNVGMEGNKALII